MSNAVHVYVSQAHKGELVMGAGIDGYNGYAPARVVPHHRAPDGGRARALPDLRARARAADVGAASSTSSPDASPIIGPTPIGGLYLDCGWGTGGFKATPGVGLGLRRTRSRTASRTSSTAPFALERFTTGALIDEHGAAAVAH